MHMDVIIGLALLVISLSTIICLVVWSCRTIEQIANSGGNSLREIKKELENNGKR